MPDRLPAEFIFKAMNSNHKQTALITGASSGIGLGLTQGFLDAGFNVLAGFMVAWNLCLLSITVIALGGMFVTANLSYALGEHAVEGR